MPSTSTHPARATRTARLLGALALLIALLALTAPAARAVPGQSISLEETVVANSVEAQSLTVPSGTIVSTVLKYRCNSSGSPCQGGDLTVVIPTGLTIITTGTSSHVTNVVSSGNSREFQMADLAPGATGAISIEVSVPDTVTPDSATFSWTSTMTGTNTATVTSNTVSITSRAQATTSAQTAFAAGGGVDGVTTYSVRACDARYLPESTWGPMGIRAGSQLSVSIPTGAVIVDQAGATLSTSSGNRSLTWTLPALNVGCTEKVIALEYPTSDTSNTVGATKRLDTTWIGRVYGESADHPLGTGSMSHNLIAPTPSMSPFKTVDTPRVANGVKRATAGDTVTYNMGGRNDGSVTQDSFTVSDAVPDTVSATSIGVTNFGRASGELYIATHLGADGVANTADDDQLVLDRNVPSDASQTVAISLGAGNWVTRVRFVAHTVRPGAGGAYLTLSARVLAVSRGGVGAVDGAQVVNQADFGYTATLNGSPVSDSTSKTATFTIDMPTAGVVVRNPSTTVPAGSRVTGAMSLSALPVIDANLLDPVFVLDIPAGLSLETWSGPSNLPAATMQSIPNFNGGTSTLVRFTFPAGTMALKDNNYQLSYTIRAARGVYTTKQVKGYISSTTQPVTCADNYFDSAADASDRDGDGNTTEVLCPWFADVSHPTTSAATLTTSVKGAWDSAFVDGPGIGASRPGADDSYRLTLESQATMGLDQASIIDVLPRPGDVGVISGAQRNRTSATFPVVLRARPVVPTLTGAIRTYYSTVAGPCRSDYGFSPSGCAAPAWTDWDATPPASLAAVTALKFDFGTNVLAPGDTWQITVPVTTPATGATEPDRADPNPTLNRPQDDEIAYNSAAFQVRRSDINSVLLPAEGLGVGLRMPTAYGPANQPVTASDRTSTGVGTAAHTTQLDVPAGGTVRLLDGATPVTSLDKPGIGTYTVDPATGVLTFTPENGYSGTAPAVSYQRTNVFGTSATASYTATVTRPAAPAAPARDASAPFSTPQRLTVPVPAGGRVRLLDGTGAPVTSLTVPGKGTFALDPATGQITFTPVDGYSGTVRVPYRATDAYGSSTDGDTTWTVTPPPAPTAAPQRSTGPAGAAQVQTIPVPAGSRLSLVDDGGNEVTELVVRGQGRYVVDRDAGTITFVPDAGFSGTPRAATYRVVDAYGQSVDAAYQPSVTAADAGARLGTAPGAARTPAAVPASCVSRRSLTIHWKLPAGASVRAFTLMVNGRRVARLPRGVRAAVIDMRGLRRQTVTVTLSGRTPRGVLLGTTRVYRTCREKLGSTPLDTLRLTPIRGGATRR